ncbi:hypothetical protein CKCE_0312 [Candidatus Kinetoplastibacterium crithidii (ex Angomonas deanei ATCC 30255)]|nr:hypothetical protein CKCE_0312 [Candidatus Kinetoplastibacterium crithidii (ex Angomonas deanei ATCC 30255)]
MKILSTQYNSCDKLVKQQNTTINTTRKRPLKKPNSAPKILFIFEMPVLFIKKDIILAIKEQNNNDKNKTIKQDKQSLNKIESI